MAAEGREREFCTRISPPKSRYLRNTRILKDRSLEGVPNFV